MTSTLDDARACENTDREIWRGPDEGGGDFYADSLHITKGGGLGINCGGSVYVKPIREWHRLAGGPISGLRAAPVPQCDAETRDVLWGISERVSNVIRSYMTKQTDGRLMGLLNDVAHDVHEEIMTPLVSPPSEAGRDGEEMDDFIRAVLADNNPRSDEPYATVAKWIRLIRRARPDQGTVAVAAADRGTDRNWIEDSPHENGNYQCRCCECGQMFIGHKRRVLCKLCSNLLTPSVTSAQSGGGK